MSRPPVSSSQTRHPRINRPRPPSTRPPSSADAGRQGRHKVFVQIANLQMAKARQKRIRAALQDQVETCNQEIDRINQQIEGLYEKAGIEPSNEEEDVEPRSSSSQEEGFEYEY